MEGVLMRGRDAIAVALRHPDGRIVTTTERLNSRVHTTPAGKWPFVRGLVVLYETLVIGTRWLVRRNSSCSAVCQPSSVKTAIGTTVSRMMPFSHAAAARRCDRTA